MVYDDDRIVNEAKYVALNFTIKLLSRLMNIHYDILVAQIRRDMHTDDHRLFLSSTSTGL
ncbi:hypothetical protein HanXRQr2_Chr04g0175071 [Helianthus annuus]|uniref:Uncharacterized protein n=1 Tax=Helianthus annuus TaxID=4232 RepID=A0A9K3J8Q4_HELAN|nr:hypothetical protein HanXRQr2_Chr04g0175071 [Helianthus annuus]